MQATPPTQSLKLPPLKRATWITKDNNVGGDIMLHFHKQSQLTLTPSRNQKLCASVWMYSHRVLRSVNVQVPLEAKTIDKLEPV